MKIKAISVTLALTLAVTGCSLTSKPDSQNAGEGTSINGEATEVGTSENNSVTETSQNSEEAANAGSTLAAVQKRGEPIIDSEGKYVFNPYVGAGLLKGEHPQEYWNTFYNLVEALREGKDTFECASEDAFNFCYDAALWGEYYPVAGALITVNDWDPLSYENGVGKIRYTIPKDEFLQKEKAFEEDIQSILDAAVKSEYSDFEKAFYLYDYMSKNFSYDHELSDSGTDMPEEESMNRFGTYNCLRNKKGICSGLAPSYAYLLLQCGVNAIEVEDKGSFGHAWDIVEIDGELYYSDPTWGLRGEQGGELVLDYFLMSEKERKEDISEHYGVYYYDVRLGDDVYMPYTVNGNKYDFLRGTKFASIDSDKNVLTYLDSTGNNVEYQY